MSVTSGARLVVVMVTRGRRELALTTVERLRATGRPIMLVDNASDDGTAAAARRRHPEIRVLALPINLGGAARTVGAAAAGAPYVAFCDDDSWFEPGALARAESLLDTHRDVALLAARVLVGAAGRLDPTCEAMARSPLPSRAGLPGRPVLGFLACAAVVRAAPFLAVGGFHPRLGIGGEEELLATDLARAGWSLVYDPDVVAHHEPPGLTDRRQRQQREVRNALWSAWLRRRLRGSIRRTAVVLAAADSDVRWAAVAHALSGLPWVLRERRAVDRDLEARLRLIQG